MNTDQSPEQQVLAAAEARSAALVDRDAEKLTALLSPAFRYTNASGMTLDRNDYIRTYVLDPKVVWFSQTLSRTSVSVRGDSAILQGVVHDVARFGTHDLNASFRTYQTYERHDGHWLYVMGKTSRRYQDDPATVA